MAAGGGGGAVSSFRFARHAPPRGTCCSGEAMLPYRAKFQTGSVWQTICGRRKFGTRYKFLWNSNFLLKIGIPAMMALMKTAIETNRPPKKATTRDEKKFSVLTRVTH